MRFLSSLILFFSIVFAPVVSAQTSEFNIRLTFGVDSTPPTTPTLLSVTPIASSQIDIVWSASTDDYAVAGYVVSRDGVAIATTTLTSYSDTGLLATTTYSYFVAAFDGALNYSSSSNALATTTPDMPPPPPPEPEPEVVQSENTSTEGTVVRTVLDSFTIVPSYTSALLTLSTKHPARLELRWGRTTSYELGYVVNNRYLSKYETTVTDLEPGTTYEYEVIAYTPLGNETLLKRGQFTTLNDTLVFAPTNVSRFVGVASQSDVRLVWELPDSTDIQYVRILRNHLGFPTYLQDGAIVYQGLGTSAFDEGVLDTYSPVYYTAFVVDTDGTVSSGAVVKVVDQRGLDNPEPENISGPDSGTVQIFDNNATTTDVVNPETSPDFRIPDVSEIFINQIVNQYTFADSRISLFNDTSFIISIPRGAVSQTLKTIIATVIDPTDTRQQYSFLLKINKDQTAYEATIASFRVAGNSRIIVDIYDYESRVVSSYKKPVVFIEREDKGGSPVFPDILFENIELLIATLLLPLLWLLFILYRQTDVEDKG